MLALPNDDEFIDGKFAAQLSPGKMFSRVEADKVIEMILNKDSKGVCGTTDFSANVDALRRWELHATYRSALRGCLQQHVNYEPQNYRNKDLTPSRIYKDETDICTQWHIHQPINWAFTGIYLHWKSDTRPPSGYELNRGNANIYSQQIVWKSKKVYLWPTK